MASNELIREIAIELFKLDHPGDDPLVEAHLTGVDPSFPYVIRSGSGLDGFTTGPLFMLCWKEAVRLAVAVEVAGRHVPKRGA